MARVWDREAFQEPPPLVAILGRLLHCDSELWPNSEEPRWMRSTARSTVPYFIPYLYASVKHRLSILTGQGVQEIYAFTRPAGTPCHLSAGGLVSRYDRKELHLRSNPGIAL